MEASSLVKTQLGRQSPPRPDGCEGYTDGSRMKGGVKDKGWARGKTRAEHTFVSAVTERDALQALRRTCRSGGGAGGEQGVHFLMD